MISISIVLLALSTTSVTDNEKAVFGGGCFWCTEAFFKELNGVKNVESGYCGGNFPNPTYDDVCSGTTGHAEVITIDFDPNKISYEQLLEVFFLTHNPTTLNRQGADIGTQYRSVIFYTNLKQKDIAENLILKMNNEKLFPSPIITEVTAINNYYKAENYHQDYFKRNANQPYCRFVIQPKMIKFKQTMPQLLKK